ncbi:MAG: diaminopimelate decarboxylase [Sphingobacteriales bacterium]|jgi:diaminopimelate decarboxylase
MKPALSSSQLQDIAAQFGTPAYVYHGERIAYQYNRLAKAFSTPARFFYACKALTNINILRLIKNLGAGVDCVSINEVKLALHAGFDPSDIIFTPNSTDISEYIQAKELGVNINIDDLHILKQFGETFGHHYPVIIRFNPLIMAGGNLKISTGHADSKFGISIQQIDDIVKIVETTNLNVQGIHIHTGSDIKDIDVFMEGLKLMFDLAKHFSDLRFIDLGSGFKVPYKEGDPQINIEKLGAEVSAAFQLYAKETGRKLEVWFEPGKFLVSESGYFIVNANIVKHTPARTFVGVNSGFNHLIRPMFYDAYHHIVNISNQSGEEKIYSVVGNICETDTFAWDRKLNEVREGDLLVFYNAGAYGFEMSSNFNSRLKPAEILVLNDQFHLIRKRDEFTDLLRNQIDLDLQ